jgi:hypothetical protein
MEFKINKHNHTMKGFRVLKYLLLLVFPGYLYGQNLSFSSPSAVLPAATTDKAIAMTEYKGHFFIAWKGAGNDASLHYCYLGRQHGGAVQHTDILLPEPGATAPAWVTFRDRLYLMWITADNSIHYLVSSSDTGFDLNAVHHLELNGALKPGLGIAGTATGDELFLLSHHTGTDQLMYLVSTAGPEGILSTASPKAIPQASTGDCASLLSTGPYTLKIAYKGLKDKQSYTMAYDRKTDQWSGQSALNTVESRYAPQLFRFGPSGPEYVIWGGNKKDQKLYYQVPGKKEQEQLPDFFSTTSPVTTCRVDDNSGILACAGTDGRLYLSSFSGYNPATWMQDILYPAKSKYTLKDIVLPGAHDAGMSVLSGTGGIESGSINECNTLTQSHNIGEQLNMGLRMFDLRVGTFNNDFYAKHCSSDCMTEAMGGGYGERMRNILDDIKSFLEKNRMETVIITFSHFCEKETPAADLAGYIQKRLGKDLIYERASGKSLRDITLQEVAGKVIVVFEHLAFPGMAIDSSSTLPSSKAFINFKRSYAATSDLKKLTAVQESFFNTISGHVQDNDLVRLDWQLTQNSPEAALVCNDFQSEQAGIIANSAMLLTNVIRNHKTIMNLSLSGNQYLTARVNDWIGKGTINEQNKPNILYVDVAGTWITDYCVDLNTTRLYSK